MWLLGVAVRRYIDFLILLIPTPLVSVLFYNSIPTFCSFKKIILRIDYSLYLTHCTRKADLLTFRYTSAQREEPINRLFSARGLPTRDWGGVIIIPRTRYARA